MPEYVVRCDGLTKVYPSGKVAIKSLTMEVKAGSIHSMLGRNGAGKTTFSRIISTILEPSSGVAEVLGFDIMKNPAEIRKRIAVVPQESRPFSLQTPFEHVFMYLVARGVSFREARERSNRVLDEMGLSEYKNIICGNLSGGLRQKVMISMAIAADAELIMLDEPTIGLDPLARIDVWNIIKRAARGGTTVFMTTHYMDEAEFLSDTITIMDAGRIVAEGSPSDLKKSLGYTTTVLFSGRITGLKPSGQEFRKGESTRILTDRAEADRLIRFAAETGTSVTVRPTNIEDVFLKLVGDFDE